MAGGTGVRISAGVIDFQTYSSSRPTLQPTQSSLPGVRGFFPRVKGEESDVDYWPIAIVIFVVDAAVNTNITSSAK